MIPVGEIELSGSDYFLFAMDRIMRAAARSDSQCRMVVELRGRLDPETFREAVHEEPFLRWMANVGRSRQLPFTIPRWKSNGSGILAPVTGDTGEKIGFGRNGSFLSFPGIPGKNGFRPPLSFALAAHEDGRSTCVVNWDHTLMDAHGAEILLRYMARHPERPDLRQMFPGDAQILDSRLDPSLSFMQRLSYARKSVCYIARTSEMPIAVLKPDGEQTEPADQYCMIRFSREETERIIARCEAMGLSYYHSLFYLAATLRAIHAVRMRRGDAPFPYLVPVPLNLRKKGGGGPAFSNRVSFLFYRVDPGEVEDFGKTVLSLKNQMKEQVVQEIPYSYVEMMNILRRLPLSLYSRLLSGPTRGRFASFFFSYTGECCAGMDSFMGQEVKEVVHLAPATSIPGLSVVFMRHRNRLKTILSLRDSLLTREELALFEEQLRGDLLPDQG